MLFLVLQVEYMQEYLRDNHGRRPAFNVNQRMELNFLRDQVAKLSTQVGQVSNENSTADEAADHSDSELSSSGSDGEDDVFDLPMEEVKKNAAKRGPRASVSAEAFGNWNKKEEFKAPFYPKSEELTSSLRNRLNQAFMFSNLNPDELEIVLGAMQKFSFAPGQQVIKQGDDGDNLYVVETGKLACTKRFVSTHIHVDLISGSTRCKDPYFSARPYLKS